MAEPADYAATCDALASCALGSVCAFLGLSGWPGRNGIRRGGVQSDEALFQGRDGENVKEAYVVTATAVGARGMDSACEILCTQCGCLVCEPVTMENGRSVCKGGCATKYRAALISPKLPAYVPALKEIGFGSKVNICLNELVRHAFAGPCVEAADTRLAGNDLFAKKQKYAEAAEAYSNALALAIKGGDHAARVLILCNRSAARVKEASNEARDSSDAENVQDQDKEMAEEGREDGARSRGLIGLAIEDALAAARLCLKTNPEFNLIDRAWFRIGAALHAKARALTKDEVAEVKDVEQIEAAATFAFALAAAAAPSSEASNQDEIKYKPAVPPMMQESASKLSPSSVETIRSHFRLGDDQIDLQSVSFDQRVVVELYRSIWDGNGQQESSELGSVDDRLASSSDLKNWAIRRLECGLCMELMLEPCTTPCGHSFCKACLARTLDHAFDTVPCCPLCRTSLGPYLCWVNATARARESHGTASIPIDAALQRILTGVSLGSASEQRAQQVARQEAAAAGGDEMQLTSAGGAVIPLFICSLALPSVACPLHIFEPRYRLMVRRVLDSGHREFGMCVTSDCEYGTMLQITEYDQLPDGRAALKTNGGRRFKIVQRGAKDGYATAVVNWVTDMNEDEEIRQDLATSTTAANETVQASSQNEGSDAADSQAASANTSAMLTPTVVRKAPQDEDQLPTVLPQAERLVSLVEQFLEHAFGDAKKGWDRLEQQLGPRPPIDGSDGRSLPAFTYYCLPLLNQEVREQYNICFGDETRTRPLARLKQVLSSFEEKALLVLGGAEELD